jgi:hypothetical protein
MAKSWEDAKKYGISGLGLEIDFKTFDKNLKN